MHQNNHKEIQLKDIFHQIIKELKIITLEQCQAVWESFIKTTISHVDAKKSILVFDMFYITTKNINNFNTYKWSPTQSFLSKHHLAYDEEIPQLGMTIILSKQKMTRNFDKQQCLKTFGNSQNIGWSILEYFFKYLTNSLVNNQNVQIHLEFFGIIRVHHHVFQHFVREDKNMRIKKLLSPNRRSSKNLRISRRSSKNLFREQTIENLSEDSTVIVKKKNSHLSPLGQSKNFNELRGQQKNKGYKQRSFMNNLLTPDARISNDLLGAGIDPLRFDYNYSKYVNETSKLFYKTFTKPKPAKIRHPGIIDKFERTTGVPQTGLKVSNSVIVRIGSNYNHYAKYIYCDIKSKSILLVPRQLKISFSHNTKDQIECATMSEEYDFVLTGNEQLKEKVRERERNYNRYTRYIQEYIQNNNVCPMSNQSITKILNLVKSGTPDYKNPVNIAIMDKAMNEANIYYYRAYKKSILDYILKDQKQKERTGIKMIFNPPIEWGESRINQNWPIYSCKNKINIKKVSKILEQNLFHQQCIQQVAELNLKMKQLDLFRIKNQDNKPVNVLYFIKKQNTHISDIITYLSSDWIKIVGDIVEKHIDFEKYSEKKTNTFIRLVNVMLSNTLKYIVYQSFEKLVNFFKKFSIKQSCYQAPILQISIMDQNGRFILSDDFRKILKESIKNLIITIIEESKKIHGIEFYLKDQSNSYLWSKEKDQLSYYEQTIEEITKIIEQNCVEIDKFTQNFKQYEKILKYQQQTLQWLKINRTLEEIDKKYEQISQMQSLIENIPFCFVNKMVLIQCFDQKLKLKTYLNNLKSQIYQNLQNFVKKTNLKNFSQIEQIKRNISTPIENTADYLKVSTDLQQVKKRKLIQLSSQISYNNKCLLKLHTLGYGFVYTDLIHKIYKANNAFRGLNSKISYHEDRLIRQKSQLQMNLREKIKLFELTTSSQLSTVSSRIEQFQIRRVYSDYLIQMTKFKGMVEENNQTVLDLNKQQQNLKLSKTTFHSAEQLKNIVFPNYELWILVHQYDAMMKEWKNKQIYQMDAANVKKRVEDINMKVSKNYKKLKNLSSLKVTADLQKDIKTILNEQIQIIQIFSHPGLKERHWQFFNSKLMIPGVDLKEITYSKIKIFQQYKENLKALQITSKQAAKQYQIETERNQQQQYWMGVSFETYSSKVENTFCISQIFLNNCLALLEQNTNKLAVMKNYIYSKALYQHLQEWQLWLVLSKKNLQNIRSIQSQLGILKPLFSYDQIGKLLPVENSQFQSIDNYWKTLTKKIWEHSKLFEFMKSPKVSQMIEQILKKIQVVKRGIPIFLMSKRSEFPRFYFIDDIQLTSILAKAAYPNTEKEALEEAFNLCFRGGELIQGDQKFVCLKSETDKLALTADVYQLKAKKKICQNLTFLQRCIRQSVRSETIQLLNQQIYGDLSQAVQKNSLTSIFCTMNISFPIQLARSIEQKQIPKLNKKKHTQISKVIQLLKQLESKTEKQQQDFAKRNKIIKLQKVILSLIGEVEKISIFQNSFYLSLESFQYLSLLKFALSKENNCDEKTQNSPKTQSVQGSKTFQKFNSACKAISQLRRSSKKQPSVANKYRVNIEVMGKYVQYRQQFWGDQVHNYLPAFTQKAIYSLLNTALQNKINAICLQNGYASTLVRKLAIVFGRHYTQVDHSFYSKQDGFTCLLHAIVTSKSWFYAHADLLKLNHKHYDEINSLICQIRDKRSQTIEQKINNHQKVTSYLKSLTQVCVISFKSVLFLEFCSIGKYQEIPISFRTEMRSISLVQPPLPQFLKEQSKSFMATLKQNKNKKFKNSIFELTSFYQNPDLIQNQLKQLNKISRLNSMNQVKKIEYELLSQFVSKQFSSQNRPNKQLILSLLENNQLQSVNSNPTTAKSTKVQTIHLHQSQNSENMSISRQRDKITYKQLLKRNKSQLTQTLKTNDFVVLYGSFDVKTQIVKDVISEVPGYYKVNRDLYSFPAAALDLSNLQSFLIKIVENLVLELNKIFAGKSFKKFLKENKRQIYIHFQHIATLEEHMITALIACAEKIKKKGITFLQLSQKTEVSIKIVYDCYDICHISPSTALKIGKVLVEIPENFSLSQFYCQWLNQNIKIDEQRSEDSRVNYESVMFSLKNLQSLFECILNTALKALSVKPGRSIMHIKYILTVRFLRMYKIYIDHLDDKEIDQYIDYNVDEYIINSFIYCVYWTICVGFLKPHQHFLVEQILVEHYPEIEQIKKMSKYMLNEQNLWLAWDQFKEQFALTEVKNVPLYNIWISTEENMKLYTNVIKLLQKGLKVMVIGQKCSGKSTLLKQISNFQMSYNSFLIDCHRLTQADQIGQVIKNRIFYSKLQKKLILIDDLCLPNKQIEITQVIKKIIEENILTCKFQYSSPYFSNKSLKNTIGTLITYSSQCPNQQQTFRSLHLLESKVQTLNIRSYDQNQIVTIFSAYINYELDRLKLKNMEKVVNFDEIYCNFICKIYKKFTLDFHTISKINKLFFVKLNNMFDGEDLSDAKHNLMDLMRVLNSSLYSILSNKPNFEAIKTVCFQQTSKILNTNSYKNLSQFNNEILNQKYINLPLPLLLLQNRSGAVKKNHLEQRSFKQKMEYLSNLMEDFIIQKDQNIKYIPITESFELILKISSILKICPSHIIFLSEISPNNKSQDSKWIQPSGFGARTITKIVSYLCSINFNEIQHENITNFINDSLNIIKVGGKVDESISFLSTTELKSIISQKVNEKQLLTMINSFICSPELHQFFTEPKIEQIFVKFSSQRKTLKRTQFIKKVREKIYYLFHFVLSLDLQQFHEINKNYPNMTKQCHIIPLYKFPQESLYEIAAKLIMPEEKRKEKQIAVGTESSEQERQKMITNSLVQIYHKFEKIQRDQAKIIKKQQIIKFKMRNIYQYFDIYRNLQKKYDQLNRKQELNNQIWTCRRKETEQKYEELLSQKKRIIEQNGQSQGSANFQQISKAINQIQPILNIFTYFQKVIKTGNKSFNQDFQNIPINRALGCLIMATAFISFAYYITNEELWEVFWSSAKDIIKANGLEVEERNIFDSILNSEERFKNKYSLIETNDNQTLCQIGLNCNTCSVLRVRKEQIINLYQWLEQTAQRRVKIIQNNEISQINQCLCNGYIGLIVNPTKQMIKKLKPLLNNEVEVKNGTVLVKITQQTIINQMSRIIFVLTNEQIRQTSLDIQNTYVSNLWHLNFAPFNISPSNNKTKENYKKQRIKNVILKKKSNRNRLIEEHLQLFQELSKIDKKIQKMIMTIRKNNENPDRIIFKIEGIFQQKQRTIAEMEDIVEQLNRIDHLHNNEQESSNKLLNNLQKPDSQSSQYQQQQISYSQHINQIYKKVENVTCVRLFNSFMVYLEYIVQNSEIFDLEKINEKINVFSSLFFDPSQRQTISQQTVQKEIQKRRKFRRVSVDQFSSSMKQEGHKRLWFNYLDTILNLKSNERKSIKISINKNPIQYSKITSNQNQNISNGANKKNKSRNILIYKTSYIDMLPKYLVAILLENNVEANLKEIGCLNEYNAKNAAFQTVVNIVEIRNHKDWKYLSSYLNTQDEKQEKVYNKKLIVVCEKSIKIPAFLQPRAFMIDGSYQINELISIMLKLKNIQKDDKMLGIMKETIVKISQNKMKKGQKQINYQSIIQQILNTNKEKSNLSLSSQLILDIFS